MAFINKLFPTRNRKNPINYSNNTKCQCHQNNVCEKSFTFAVEQVQVAVFKECDFRGRKLLFDSRSVEKVQLDNNNSLNNEADKNVSKQSRLLHSNNNHYKHQRHLQQQQQQQQNEQQQFVEITNGFGYMLTKPNSDLGQLREMIFGSVAMTYRGTLYKIHNLTLPPRLVYSQVFPSPRVRNSAPNQSSQQTNTSLSLDQSQQRLDDSAGSSQTSYSDHSTSDQLSTASDTALLICRRRQQSVPLDVPINSSLISSSGYGGELSNSSISSGPQSMPMDLNECTGFSNSFSENLSHRSLPTSMCLGEDVRTSKHRRANKLGLAIILELTREQENDLETFFMQHVALIETILWRLRQGVEVAYVRHQTFVSAMYEISTSTAQWFVDFLTCNQQQINVWRQLNNCDIPNSIKCDFAKHLLVENSSYNSDSDFGFRTLTKKLFNKAADRTNAILIKHIGGSNKCEHLEKFIKDLCELVENFDVKQTNFFLSTLMTGILTHHLGWVSTVLPKDEIKCKRSSNLLVQQLCDLYGCMGYPSKIAHTIITGSNQDELINKFINVLTYFIRCDEIKNRNCERNDIDVENKEADDKILIKSNNANENIPKSSNDVIDVVKTPEIKSRQSFHNLVTNNNNSIESFQLDKSINSRTMSMSRSTGALGLSIKKSRTCLGDLNKLQQLAEDSSQTRQLNLKQNGVNVEVAVPVASVEIERNINELRRKHFEREPKVLFVLGENEKLEKLKTFVEPETESNEQVEMFDDCDFVLSHDGTDIAPSLSCSNLKTEGAKPKRAQSEEPSPQTTSASKKDCKTSKYRYAGVKFNFQQYPQIFANYMKSKNIELSEMQMQDKNEFLYSQQQFSNLDFSKFDDTLDSEDDEPLQTPSNASELEYTSELVVELPCKVKAKEILEKDKKPTDFTRYSVPNTLIIPESHGTALKMTDFPLPQYKYISDATTLPFQFSKTLLRSSGHHYLPNMALQGVVSQTKEWQSVLKRDLILSAKHPIAGEPVEESVAIIGNIDSWDVKIISSHTFVIDKTVGGVPVGMSQLVANMLETLLHMWKLRTPPEYCLMHIEQKLREFCMQSKALAQMLMDTEFCTIELLTSALKLEVNDVPLLLAVASIHTPEVTQKYGLRFQ